MLSFIISNVATYIEIVIVSPMGKNHSAQYEGVFHGTENANDTTSAEAAKLLFQLANLTFN